MVGSAYINFFFSRTRNDTFLPRRADKPDLGSLFRPHSPPQNIIQNIIQASLLIPAPIQNYIVLFSSSAFYHQRHSALVPIANSIIFLVPPLSLAPGHICIQPKTPLCSKKRQVRLSPSLQGGLLLTQYFGRGRRWKYNLFLTTEAHHKPARPPPFERCHIHSQSFWGVVRDTTLWNQIYLKLEDWLPTKHTGYTMYCVNAQSWWCRPKN